MNMIDIISIYEIYALKLKVPLKSRVFPWHDPYTLESTWEHKHFLTNVLYLMILFSWYDSIILSSI